MLVISFLVRRGISIQKNVNLEFDQIFASTAFIPPLNRPIDVHASIKANRLQVIIVASPETTASQGYFFGPFDITGSTSDKGKIGVFSWAQNTTGGSDAGTEVDWVKVQQVQGEALIISSAFGTPSPPNGLHDFPLSTTITASVQNVINSDPGVRQVCLGWTGLGSVPANGATNEVVFSLNSFSGVTWKWQTEYTLATAATAGGTVVTTNGAWVPAGSNVLVTAVANPGYLFVGWSGSTIQTGTNLLFAMTRPTALTAQFAADADADNLPDEWEMRYFGGLAQTASGDPDADGVSNLVEYERGSNPSFTEILVAVDGLSSKWVNTGRDPSLPGELFVTNFAAGYRGVWSENNEFRNADDAAFIPANNLSNQVSFQTHRLIARSNLWNPSWASNFTASMDFSVGDDDGNCFYFRYVNESNWFRVTLCGQNDLAAIARPVLGLSIQRRTNGFHSAVPFTVLSGSTSVTYTDPTDGMGTPAGYKKVRVTVSATNENFEVRVTPWDYVLEPDDFNPASELVVTFTDTALPNGRIGFGFWGQGGFGGNANEANGIPIPYGAFVDNVSLRSPANGAVVFSDDWEIAPSYNQLPAGWSNPYAGTTNLQGNWRVNADGSIAQLANEGGDTTGTAIQPKADADANILLGPALSSGNYLLVLGFQPFDNDGIGFVYDFQDTNNFSRVFFKQEGTIDGSIPPGVSISRKSGGAWTDIVAADPSFLYVPGRPFEAQFGNNNGDYHLIVRDLDNPATVYKWHWTAQPAAATNLFGVTSWFSQNAHMLYASASALPAMIRITDITVNAGQVTLKVACGPGYTYDVLRADAASGPYQTITTAQSSPQFSEPLPVGNAKFYRLKLNP